MTSTLFALPRQVDQIVAGEQTSHGRVVVRQLVTGLDRPWSLAFLEETTVLITERPGTLFLVQGLGTQSFRVSEVTGLPDVAAVGQGGLLDIVPDPNYPENSLVYFSYAAQYDGGYGTRVDRAQLVTEPDRSFLAGRETLFTVNHASSGGRHFGSRLVFDPGGRLIITLGDRGDRDRAQDSSDHAGSTVRINRDGTVPDENPFSDLPELFTIGHRNAQGIAVHPETGAVWLHEHGPRGGDEINILVAGENYGWPEVTHGREYSGGRVSRFVSKPGLRDPLLHWTPSIAPSGMTFYRGAVFPQWNNDVFVGALAGQHLRRVNITGSTVIDQEQLLSGFGRIRDVRTGQDGYLYFITDSDSAGLYRIEPAD